MFKIAAGQKRAITINGLNPVKRAGRVKAEAVVRVARAADSAGRGSRIDGAGARNHRRKRASRAPDDGLLPVVRSRRLVVGYGTLAGRRKQ